MKFLLDTNAVIALMKNAAPFCENLRRHSPVDCGISAVVTYELAFGAFHSARAAENIARVRALQFEVLPFDQEDAECAGEIRAGLAKTGNMIGPYDIMIAGQAIARGLTLISRNTREFSRVKTLTLENWEA